MNAIRIGLEDPLARVASRADVVNRCLKLDPQRSRHATQSRYQISKSNVKCLDLTPSAYFAEGWLYLVAVLDLFGRRVVGWAMSPLLDAPLVIAALRMGLQRRQPPAKLILHSDRGSQFASAAFRQLLAENDLVASMSRPANCYDNAFIESFWSTLKYELVYHQRFASRAAARTAVFDYIETFYNRTRLHSSLAYRSPISFESQLNQITRA